MTSLPQALWIFAVHILLTMLPVVAAYLVATAAGVTDRLLQLSLGLCGLMVTGYLTFWIFWASPAAGRIFAILLTPTLVVVVIWFGFRLRSQIGAMGAELLRPILVWVAGSVLIFSLGTMYTSGPNLTTTAESRYVAALPIDNEIPLILSTALQSPRRPLARPLYVIWDSSDRPPLQAGVYLSQEAILPGSDARALHYEVVGVLLQGLWIFGIWGLLAAVRARARLAALLLTAILFSGFVVLNTYFTWPKLFPATYLVLLVALLLTPKFEGLRGSAIAGVTAGALAGAALLGHEGSSLALLALIIVMVIQRRRPSKRFVLGALALLVVTQGTWMVYQRVIDPPGDQLARLQIANQLKLPGDRRPLLTVVVAAYEKAPFGTIVDNKLSNLDTPFSDIPEYLVNNARMVESYFMTGRRATARRSAAVDEIRLINFFNLVPSVGFLSLGFFACVAAVYGRKRLTPLLRLASTIWIFLIANIITWALILFGPRGTVIHQGTYLTGLLTFTACVIGLWALSRRLCAALVILQATLAVIVYGLNGPPDNVVHHFDQQMLVLAVVSLVLTVAALSFASTGPRLDMDDYATDALHRHDDVPEKEDPEADGAMIDGHEPQDNGLQSTATLATSRPGHAGRTLREKPSRDLTGPPGTSQDLPGPHRRSRITDAVNGPQRFTGGLAALSYDRWHGADGQSRGACRHRALGRAVRPASVRFASAGRRSRDRPRPRAVSSPLDVVRPLRRPVGADGEQLAVPRARPRPRVPAA